MTGRSEHRCRAAPRRTAPKKSSVIGSVQIQFVVYGCLSSAHDFDQSPRRQRDKSFRVSELVSWELGDKRYSWPADSAMFCRESMTFMSDFPWTLTHSLTHSVASKLNSKPSISGNVFPSILDFSYSQFGVGSMKLILVMSERHSTSWSFVGFESKSERKQAGGIVDRQTDKQTNRRPVSRNDG